MSALLVAGISIIGQVLIGYWWKRGVEAKDEKISKLEERVDEMDTRRITGIERDVTKGEDSRRKIYERMDKIEITAAGAARDLAHALSHLPKIEEVSRQMSATAATLERVTEQVATMEARLYGDAAKIGELRSQR